MIKNQNPAQPITVETDSLSSSRKPGGSVVEGLIIEAGIITSMTCYYLAGNSNLGDSWLFHLNPLYSLPFLLVFVLFCWYRLAFVVALFPLTLPYYHLPKPIYSHYSLSLAEITLLVCLSVALLQLLGQRVHWKYWPSWQTLRSRVGLFALPMLALLVSALLAVSFVPNHVIAFRAFSQTVLEPIIYFALVLLCLRSRSSLERLLWALMATGCLLAFLGIAQFLFFSNQLKLGADGIPQITVVYGNAKALGILADYLLPGSLALLLIGIWQGPKAMRFWGARAGGIALCLLLLLTLYLSQARRSQVALVVAFFFIGAFAIRNRTTLLIGIISLLVIGTGIATIFHAQLAQLLFAHQSDPKGVFRMLWESVGPFGLLAITALVALFFWCFCCILVHLCSASAKEQMYMRWITVGAGGTMIAVLTQAGVDNVFLGQDTSYLFWTCLAIILLLRELSETGWRGTPAPVPSSRKA